MSIGRTSTGWAPPLALSLDGGFVQGSAQTGISVSANATGAALIAWHEFVSSQSVSRVWAVSLNTDGGFSAPEQLNTSTMGNIDSIGTGVDELGNAWVTFVQPETPGGLGVVWGRWRPAGASWRSVVRVSPQTTTATASAASLSVGASGPSVVSYTFGADVHAAMHLTDGGWLDRVIDGTTFNVAEPHTSTGPNGEAVVTWRQYRGAGLEWDTAAARFHGGAWFPADTLSNPDAGHATTPRAAVDAQGQALVVWSQAASSPTLYSAQLARFDGATWSAPTSLGAWTFNPLDWGNVALNANGVGAVTWHHGNLMAARVGVPYQLSAPFSVSSVTNLADFPARLGVSPAGERWALFPAFQAANPQRGLLVTHCP